MRIVLWVGNQSNQIALCNKVAEKFNLVGVVTETKASKRKLSLKILIEKVIEKTFLRKINNAWFGLQKYYSLQYPKLPKTVHLDVENINSISVKNFTENLEPDLIVVSGTRLIKKELLAIRPSKGIINLHTGLSPYIKGGPNCTNWCIAEGTPELIGNTIMWIDEGIDTGNIITTELTPFADEKTLNEIHIRVMEHAHELYLKAIDFIIKGGRNNFSQNEIAEGKTYYTKQWTIGKKIKLVRNIDSFAQRISQRRLKLNGIKVVSLDQ
jgi:methionyl-tRNA formyltransferase